MRYYLSVAPGALAGIRDRPIVLKRFVNGAEGEAFYQKRAPAERPSWLRTVTLSFPSGRTAEEVVVDDAAGLAWIVNLGCIELHPHPVRSGDLEHPDELRVDLDPGPGVGWADVRTCRARGESASRGDGASRLAQDQRFTRNARECADRAALDLRRGAPRGARAVARSRAARCPRWPARNGGRRSVTACSSTTTRTRRIARPAPRIPCARFPTPVCPRRFTGMRSPTASRPTSPCSRFRSASPRSAIRTQAWTPRRVRSKSLLELAAKDEAAGLGDAPWPPHFRKMEGEAPRVAPSRAKSAAKKPRTKMPLLVVANSPDKEAALAGLERWKSKHPEAAELLAVDDVLVDSMRGRSSTWTRIRVNLRHVPEALRPPQETPDPDDDPTREWRERRQ